MTDKEPEHISNSSQETKKAKGPAWINQHNVETVCTFIAGCLLAFELIPHTLSEYVKGTPIGLYIILALAVFYILRSYREQVKELFNIISISHAKLEKKDSELKELAQKLSTTQQEYTELYKTTNYSRILSTINKAFAELRQAQRENSNTPDGERLKGAIKEFCNTLHEVFEALKGQEGRTCHVCIKICTVDEKAVKKSGDLPVPLKAKTLMRDGRGSGLRTKIDTQSHIAHYVEENTDFMHVLEQSDSNNSRHFMSNDVLTIDDYQNTSLKAIKANKESSFYLYNRAPMEEKIKNWKLDYRSTIVAPISPGMAKPNVEDGTFIGFLCVDYDIPNMFTQADVEIVEGFAEGLYDTLDQYLQQYILKTRKN